MKQTTSMLSRSVPWVIAIPMLVGCNDSQVDLVRVRGRITMLDKPVKDVMISFAPIGETPGSGAIAAADADGQFELMDMRESMGVRPGQYKVHLYPAPAIKTEGPPTDVVFMPRGSSIPAIYIDPNRTPLVADVPASGGYVEVMLTRDGNDAKTITNPLSD